MPRSPRNYAREYLIRTALPRLAAIGRELGIPEKDIPRWMASEIEAAQAALNNAARGAEVAVEAVSETGDAVVKAGDGVLALGADLIEAAAKQIAKVGKGGFRLIGALTVSQARGHARKRRGEQTLRAANRRVMATPEQKYADVVRAVRSGKSLTAARKEAGLSERAFKRLNRDYSNIAESGLPGRRRYIARATITETPLVVIDRAGTRHQAIFIGADRQAVFDWRDAVATALETGSDASLRKLRGIKVRDIDGKQYSLMTDHGQLRKLWKETPPDDQERYSPFRFVDRLAA